MFSDSDTEQDYYQEPGPIALGIEGLRDFPSTTASISSTTASAAPISGPVIPSILLQGTTMTKVTKKKNKKMLTFVSVKLESCHESFAELEDFLILTWLTHSSGT